MRVSMTLFLVLLGGCGSCLDDRKPDVDDGPPKIKMVTTTTDAGKRLVVVGDSVKFSSVVGRDGGSSEQR